jgi:hypothetical protein
MIKALAEAEFGVSCTLFKIEDTCPHLDKFSDLY